MNIYALLALLKQKWLYLQAEMTPNDAKRRARRDRYNYLYDCCEHGLPREECPGRADPANGCEKVTER